MTTREEAMERAIDREVQHRLATDHAYLYAENADEQAGREREIEKQVVREFEAQQLESDKAHYAFWKGDQR